MGIRVFPLFLPVTLCAFLILPSVVKPDAADGTLGNGFGENYDWMRFEDGFKFAEVTKRPVMLLIHQPWCGACKALKPLFAQSSLIKELSEKFVMINTVDDDEIMGESYKPDGGYIPRILFFDSNGELLKDVINEGGSPKYKYYYHEDESITKSMRAVLKQIHEQINKDTANGNVKIEL